ncbi:MAG: hypothetical protein LBV17_04285 [Treponema sp.]|nr:hypothetical protein [Treponema sp.]
MRQPTGLSNKSNKYNNKTELINLIDKFSLLNYKIEIHNNNNLENQIKSFFDMNVVHIELNIFLNICGRQRSKIYIEYLSDEVIEIDFCFLEEKINENIKNKLKRFFNDSMELYDGIAGMIGCETTCSLALFEAKNHIHIKIIQ